MLVSSRPLSVSPRLLNKILVVFSLSCLSSHNYFPGPSVPLLTQHLGSHQARILVSLTSVSMVARWWGTTVDKVKRSP
ncbi:Uncharacterized protein HZ326_27159 [Fusarium oxysporum f. sp. albedinis]|nr:Uncharacterized protein HZ326_27159 [Fusarium oxysporum f. sp. albedinis]